jgi:uptake hydrogenase large subunit
MSLLAPGTLAISVAMRDGVVASVDIRSDRPISLASRLVGRAVGEATAAVGLLHAVCGRSHAATLQFAADAALGRIPSANERRLWSVRLAAERIGEHLRELLIEHSDEAVLPQAREAIALAQSLARDGLDRRQLDPLRRHMEALRPWLDGKVCAPGIPLGNVMPALDALSNADDRTVFMNMAAVPDFPARPFLPKRCPEVGPAARLGGTAAIPGATRAARRAEIDTALADISLDAFTPDSLMIEPGRGFAAVESPRGRLSYLVEVTSDSRLADARVLAPTEWNFHPSGPFARALVGLRPEGDRQAGIARLATDFCPCVAIALTVTDSPHA